MIEQLMTHQAKLMVCLYNHTRVQPRSTKQQVNQLALSNWQWNVYLHHPRGTVRQIAGPFSDIRSRKKKKKRQATNGIWDATPSLKATNGKKISCCKFSIGQTAW